MMTSQLVKTKSPQRESSRKYRVFLCKICLCNLPMNKGTKLGNCHCIFCEECIRHYLEHSIADGNILSIECPDGNCPKKLPIPETQISKILDEATYKKYKKLKKIKEITIDKSKTFCPVAGCEGVSTGMPGTPQQTDCKECGYCFCFLCKEPWHPEKTCKENISNTTDIMSSLRLFDIISKGDNLDIKECPLCSILIQRDAGCAQMMCGNCKHMFCWHCKQSLDSDLLLRHYDKGPCRNKLGHSRATLFLHRTQVIAGFVFFGAMIVVASPFLLIISPCLLLSKICNHQSEKDNDQERSQ